MVAVKNRYMVMEVFIDPNRECQKNEPVVLTQSNVLKAIKESILLNFGECGLASSLGSFQVKYINPITNVCIIRTSREAHQRIWCAITLIQRIASCSVFFNLLDLSGCIRACRLVALKCDEAKFEQLKIVSGDRLSPETIRLVKNCFEKIKILDH
ncbi:ribonuclease P family protein / Rpp14 family protein [Wolffia australiana]